MDELTQPTKKFKYQQIFLMDLPAELKYRILDFLDATSLKRCRLLNKTFLQMIDNTAKYNKHWILDVSGWPVTADQEFVQLYTNSGMKFGRFVGHTTKFTFIPDFFQKLGKTVTYIKDLPFKFLNRETTELFIKTFDKVEVLKLKDNILLCNMRQWQLVWPSVKRLTIYSTLNDKEYKGDFSEFPHVQEITLRVKNLITKQAKALLKACPQKITGIKSMNMYESLKDLYEVRDLSLKRLKLRQNVVDVKFLQRQTEIISYHIYTESFSDILRPLPACINLANVHSLDVSLLNGSKFDLKWLHDMPNLKKFGLQFKYFPVSCAAQVFCFLKSHEALPNQTVKVLDVSRIVKTCLNCLRSFLESFANLKKLQILYWDSDFCNFWKTINRALEKTGASVHLSTFKLNTDFCENKIKVHYNYFAAMTPFPNLKTLQLMFCHKRLSKNALKTLFEKCPNLRNITFGVGRRFNYQLSSFLIHQLKYFTVLRMSNYTPEEIMLDEHCNAITDIYANAETIQSLRKTPLKLWCLGMPLQC
ncbi:uncharacterized protein LOC134831597 [Culicoides brevitarsis]|uniref:uncharacterized protein LOC134831597 n=1 Tax=Culicoides brevitarsis TaxID=469753 RepID=UPI00307B9457